MDNADVVADRGHRRRSGRGAGINADAVGAAGGGLVAGAIGNAGRVTQVLGMGERAGVAIGPAADRNRGGTQEVCAVVDADAFTTDQVSGERAADR